MKMMLSIAGLCLLHSVSGMNLPAKTITREDFASAKEMLMNSQSCFEQFVAQHVKELDDLYDGEPLLQHCVRENKADYCCILIEAGASKSKMYKPTWSAKDMNIVDLAEFYGSFECVKALKELGLKSAADTAVVTEEELAEATAALENHRRENVTDPSRDCDEKDEVEEEDVTQPKSPYLERWCNFSYFTAEDIKEMIEEELQRPNYVNPSKYHNYNGTTFLQDCAEAGDVVACAHMLDAGARVNTEDKLGRTALDVALSHVSNTRYGHRCAAVVQLLRSRGGRKGSGIEVPRETAEERFRDLQEIWQRNYARKQPGYHSGMRLDY